MLGKQTEKLLEQSDENHIHKPQSKWILYQKAIAQAKATAFQSSGENLRYVKRTRRSQPVL
jgi:hypothetical protein